MLLDHLSDKRKTSTSKLFIIGIILVVILVAVGVAGLFFKTSDSIKITKQDNFYGISGEIIDIKSDSIILETPVIPYDGSSPSPEDRWVWDVLIDENTVILTSEGHENITNAEEGDISDSGKSEITFSELKIGDLIVVTSSIDIKNQFSFDDKRLIASKIYVF